MYKRTLLSFHHLYRLVKHCHAAILFTAPVSCLTLTFHLQRIHRVMSFQVYLPTTCIMFITWLGFWIHHTEVSSRIRISVTSFTAIIAEGLAMLIINPDQVHMEAVQAWNAGCIILITAAFLEFVIVHNIHRRLEAQTVDRACQMVCINVRRSSD